MDDVRSAPTAREQLLEAAGRLLREVGYAAVSTRRVAEAAGMPLSQIHYHFGSRQKLMLALLEWENAKLLERQRAMYGSDMPLARKWALACDYLEADLASGYVRVLQEMMAAGFADPDIAASVRAQLDGWCRLLTAVTREAMARLGPVGPFEPEEVALLVGQSFLGLETLLLLDAAEARERGLPAIRKVGELIAAAEASDG